MDRTETIKYLRSEPTAGGELDISDVVDILFNGALKADKPGAPGVAWLDGKYHGQWIELRVTIRPEPEKAE